MAHHVGKHTRHDERTGDTGLRFSVPSQSSETDRDQDSMRSAICEERGGKGRQNCSSYASHVLLNVYSLLNREGERTSSKET